MKKNVVKVLSAILAASMLLGSSVDAFADGVDTSSVLKQSDEAIINAVKDADKQADDAMTAAQAAEEAYQAALNLVGTMTDEEKNVLDDATVINSDTIGNKIDDALDAEINAAKEEVDDSYEKVDALQADINAEEQDISENAAKIVSNWETIAANTLVDVSANEYIANTALETIKNDDNMYKDDALVIANDAVEAAKEADIKAQAAGEAYEAAYLALEAAQERVVALTEAASVSENAINSAVWEKEDSALNKAKADLAAAEEAMKQAKKDMEDANLSAESEYNKAVEAAKAAGMDATTVMNELAGLHDLQFEEDAYEELKKEVQDKNAAVTSAEEIQKQVNAAKDAIISEQNGIITEQSAIVSSEESARVSLETKMSEQKAIINSNNNILTASYKTRTWKLLNIFNGNWGYVYTYYTDEEKAAAKTAKEAAEAEYNRLEGLRDEAVRARDEANGKVQTATNAITAANTEKQNAQKAVDDAKIAAAAALTNFKLVNDYVYPDPEKENVEVVKLTDEQESFLNSLIADVKKEQGKFEKIDGRTKNYKGATEELADISGAFKSFDALWTYIKHFFPNLATELTIEEEYRNWDWKWKNGEETHWTFTSNSDNLKVLVSMTNHQLVCTKISEEEYATFCTTYDKVQAAQAVKRAEIAKQNEATALSNYNDAVAALEAAQAKLNALNAKSVEINKAAREVELAYGKVREAADYLERAQSKAYEAQEEAEEAMRLAGLKKDRPVPPTPGNEDDDDDDDNNTVVPTDNRPGNTNNTPTTVRRAAAPQATPQAAPQEITVAENKTPLAPAAEEPKEEAKTEMNVEENKTPLAGPIEEEASRFNWWWLLLVAALAVVGYEVYKKNSSKEKVTK